MLTFTDRTGTYCAAETTRQSLSLSIQIVPGLPIQKGGTNRYVNVRRMTFRLILESRNWWAANPHAGTTRNNNRWHPQSGDFDRAMEHLGIGLRALGKTFKDQSQLRLDMWSKGPTLAQSIHCDSSQLAGCSSAVFCLALPGKIE